MIKVLIVLMMIMSVNVYGKLDRSKLHKEFRNAPGSVIKRTIKAIDTSDISDVSKKIKIRKMSDIEKLDTVADVISKKGKDAQMLIKEGPLTTISLYSKHGDEFIEIYEKTKISIIGIPLGKYNELVKVIPVEKLSTKIAKKFTKITQSDIAKRFTQVMKTTGSKGYEISKKITKYAKEYPKSSVVGVLYLWFLADPTGFEHALKKSGDNISTFASNIVDTTISTAINVPLNVADTAGNSLVTSVKNNITPTNVIVILLLLIGWVGWKIRGNINLNIIKEFIGKLKIKIKDIFNKKSKDKGPL
jgi:hypothetical protein